MYPDISRVQGPRVIRHFRSSIAKRESQDKKCAKFLLVISLQIFDGQRVDVGPRCVKQPPRERIEDRGLIVPGDFDQARPAHDVSGQDDRMRTARFVVLRSRAQLHPLGLLAIRSDRANDEHPDLPAVG